MKRLLGLTSILMLLALCPGCGGDTHEKLAAKAIDTMKEMCTVLDGVKDEESAKAAKGKLKSLMETLDDLNKRQEKLPKPTDAEIKAMEAKSSEMMEVQQKFMGHMMRIAADPKLRDQL